MKRFLTILWVLTFAFNFVFAEELPDLILFYWETCPHCKNEEAYIAEFQEKYDFNLVWYEVYYSPENQDLMQEYADHFHTSFNWVPLVIMWEDYFLWESYEKTEELLKKYAKKKSLNTDIIYSWSEIIDVTDPWVWVISGEVIMPEIDVTDLGSWENFSELTWTLIESGSQEDQTLKILWKEISLKSVGPVLFWILLWFVDWINPCMFWVLIFLLTYLISVGSKKKVLYSGLIFVLTTFVLYFIIMYLMHKVLFSTMVLLPYIAYIKYTIWIIAIILWLIEIKDFFRYGKGVSLKIPASIKPTLEYITKRGTYMSAFVLAVLSTFVELPCTIWIPLAYVGAVWDNINIFLALGIYNLFFVVPLLVIVFGIYYGLSAFKSDENWNIAINDISSKKVMRLVAGLILVLLWVLFLMKVF